MPGVSTWNFGEGFAELFLDPSIEDNSIGRGYEHSQRNAEPHVFLSGEKLPDGRPSSIHRKSHLVRRDNLNTTETAALAASIRSHNSRTFLHNFYEKKLHSYRKGPMNPGGPLIS